jgi:hypothetical protein
MVDDEEDLVRKKKGVSMKECSLSTSSFPIRDTQAGLGESEGKVISRRNQLLSSQRLASPPDSCLFGRLLFLGRKCIGPDHPSWLSEANSA